MQLEPLAYEKLPFTQLFKTYLQDFKQLASYYHYPPFREESYRKRFRQVQNDFAIERNQLVDWLKAFNEPFNPPESTRKNIERLQKGESAVFVTGQQVNLLGGPLYTIYKTLTTIHLASYWEDQLDIPVIPVFWMADEDHDYEEIKKVVLPKSGTLFNVSYDNPSSLTKAVSRISIDTKYEEIREYLRQELSQTDFSDELWSIIDAAYHKNETLGRAFGRLMLSLFSEHGLVLAGSHDEQAKKHLTEPLKTSVRHARQIRESLEVQSDSLSKKFHQQVTIYDSNLFYHSEERGRVKIHHEEGTWYTDGGQQWGQQELLSEIDAHPHRFSPNVFLRPVLQDHLLPTIGYIGGPSEIAYYGQMKKMYEQFDLHMPVVIPRLSATVMESKIDRIYQKLPFGIEAYQQRIEDLESEYAREVEEVDVDGIFEDWKKKVQELSDEKSKRIKEIDPTLVKAVGKATAVYFNELDKLKGKVHRSTKQQEETQLNRIRKIKYQLFPNNTLQERVISFIFYMNKYGLDLWDRLLNQLRFDESYRSHQIIHL